MRKFLSKAAKLIFSQMVIVGLLLVLQAGFLIFLAIKLSEYFVYISLLFAFLSLCAVLYLVNRPGSPAGKLAWVVTIMTVPLLGGLFYLVVYGQRHPRYVRRELNAVRAYSQRYLPKKSVPFNPAAQDSDDNKKMLAYMEKWGGARLFDNTETEYYTIGEDMKAAMISAINAAENYIFLEFFIIKDGVFWQEIRSLLHKKAEEGVEVRLLYDGMGCLAHLPANYPKELAKLGIKAKVFSPFAPFLSVIQNHRDHRKIVVVDGHTAFCGGINLADEYINVTHPYGHWKDTGMRLKGEGAWAFVPMFLELWSVGEKDIEDYDIFCPRHMPEINGQGVVLPYSDSPLDNEKVGEYMYMHAITRANTYLHIMTPYLILEQSMVDAMISAAKSGIDVKLIVPAKADHWYAHAVAKAYFSELISGGVEIYEYSPGFIHAKSFVWDDASAIVGTINLDYRSLYLHFECGVFVNDAPVVGQIEQDFAATLALSKKLSLEETRVRNPFKRGLYAVLRIFSPLM